MTGAVLLVRHGETTWNRDGRIQGWADSTLTDRGREQAAAVGTRLADSHSVDRLVVSDLQRTRETADRLREGGVALDPTLSRAWRERDFGEYQGLTRTSVAARHPTYTPDGSLVAVEAVPDGESRRAFQTRVRNGFQQITAELGDGGTVAVVTHGGPIRVVLADVLGHDLPAFASEFSPTNCGLTEVRLADSGHVVACRDDTEHLTV